ncbi:MAG: VOC family protein [Rhodoferax sp.]|nr:VOC family protein [Rhodoferax sp.]
MPDPTGSFIWYELMTSDADAAARFYAAVLGWRITATPPELSGGQDYRMLERDDGGHAGGLMQLTPDMQAQGARPAWVHYLQVADVDAATQAIAADGGQVLMPKMTLPVGDMAMVADPMGAAFYVMRPVPPPGQPDAASDVFAVAQPQRVRWNELRSADVLRASAFYGRHFGFRCEDTMPMGPALGDYRFIDHGGLRVGGMMQRAAADAGTVGWMFYFGVTSITAARRAIEAGGGRVDAGPQQVPGGDWTMAATDPQGARFGVVGALGG